MGDRDGVVYLASPAVVAASAAEGKISPPSGQQSVSYRPEDAVNEKTVRCNARDGLIGCGGFNRDSGRVTGDQSRNHVLIVVVVGIGSSGSNR